jgi:protein phosphatase
VTRERRSFAERLQALFGGGAVVADTIVGEPAEPISPATRRVVVRRDACGLTEVGRVRDHNEDSFHVSEDGRLLVVADGMGGHRAGEVASELAVQTLVELLAPERRREVDDDEACAQLLDTFQEAHRRVLETSAARPACRGMGTTLIVAWISGNRLRVCHLGDGRCYVRKDDRLMAITQDHSVIGSLIRAGALSPEAARTHPRRHEILQAVGLGSGISPEVTSCSLAPGDEILLCSDGLWGMLSDEDILTVLSTGGSIEERARCLVDRANLAGGHDNITVVLFHYPETRAG